MSLLKSTLNPISQRRVKLIGLLSRAEELVHAVSTAPTTHSASVAPAPITRRYLEPEPSQDSPEGIFLNSLFDTHAHLISSHANKLRKSGHPVLALASNLFEFEDSHSYSLSSSAQLRGILVRLVAKAVGLSPAAQAYSDDVTSVILSKQKLLSEITELMHAAYLLHRAVVNLSDPDSELHHGNKLATLMGDLLLARSTKKLSQLKDNPVTELMSNSICDFSESECIGTNVQEKTGLVGQRLVDPRTQFSYSYDLWLRRTKLGLGSLLAHSCLSAMVLAGHDESIQRFAFQLGLNLGITLQAYTDLRIFGDEEENWRLNEIQPSVLWALPVIHEVQLNPHLISKENAYLEILQKVQSSPIAIPNSRSTLLIFQQQASRLLSQLKPSSARILLRDILQELANQ